MYLYGLMNNHKHFHNKGKHKSEKEMHRRSCMNITDLEHIQNSTLTLIVAYYISCVYIRFQFINFIKTECIHQPLKLLTKHQRLLFFRANSRAISRISSGEGGLGASGGYTT